MHVKWFLSILLIAAILFAGACSQSNDAYPLITVTLSAKAPAAIMAATTPDAVITKTADSTHFSYATTMASVKPSSTVVTYPPAVQDAELSVNKASGKVSVNFIVMAGLRSDTTPSNLVYYMDVNPPTIPGVTALTAEGTYVLDSSLDVPIRWDDVKPGEHTFSAQYVNAVDNTPFSPAIVVQCHLTIPAPGAATPEFTGMTCIVILPNPSSIEAVPQSITPLQVQITTTVHNFRLNNGHIGRTNTDGEGHLIYYLDSMPLSESGKPADISIGSGLMNVTTNNFLEWYQIQSGIHTFYIQMVNNDNTPLEPPVIAWFKIEIPGQI